jgi:hypothetical protein
MNGCQQPSSDTPLQGYSSLSVGPASDTMAQWLVMAWMSSTRAQTPVIGDRRDSSAHPCNRSELTTEDNWIAVMHCASDGAAARSPALCEAAARPTIQPGKDLVSTDSMKGDPMTDFFTMRPGETAAPVPSGPVLCTGSASMRRIHRFFLWAYGEAPGLVRSVEPGDTARAAYVGEVLGNFDKVLHVHHEGEDLLMYPRLAERAPGCALHIEQMLGQHRQVTQRLESIEPIRLRWVETADASAQADLAHRYEELSTVLQVHLRREVTEVMPAVDRVMTEKEGKEIGKHGVETFDKKFLVGYLGMVLATNPPGEREEFFKEIPPPVRLAYRLVGRRLYRRQYATLFPGRPIPETL